jgi:HEAT repeat protein
MNDEAWANDIPPVDWQGAPLTAATCAACPHAELQAVGACALGRSCMQDVDARRIDRFFRTHRTQANAHLTHLYFEVRRIAAQRLPSATLGLLAHDPDWTVRWEVAGRAAADVLERLLADPEDDVRARALKRLASPPRTTGVSYG